MKKALLLCLSLVIIGGCKAFEVKPNTDNPTNQVVYNYSNENDVKEKENFNNEYYNYYNDVKNLCKYYDHINPQVLVESDLRLIYEYNCDENDNEQLLKYCEDLKDLGFEYTSADAFISSTFIIENEKYNINISIIADLANYKNVHKDKDFIKNLKSNRLVEVYMK